MKCELVVTKMKFLCFLLICAIQSTICDFTENSSNSPKPPVFLLGLIVDSEMGLLKCIGTFITSNTLVTTAECLSDENLDSWVHLSPLENGTVLNYKIKSVMTHENFETGSPESDIGLVEIDGNVPDEAIMNITDVNADRNIGSVYSFTAKFINDRYYIEAKKVIMVSNAGCSRFLGFYIPETKICAYNPEKYYFEADDQGSPLIYNVDGKNYLLARYVIDNSKTPVGVRIILYQAMFPHLNWIEKRLGITHEC